MEHFVRETASDLIAYFRDAHITKTDKTSRRMNFNPKGVVQLVSWMESLSCCAFLFLLLFIYLLPSRPQYPMAHPILHTIFLIRYVKALEEVFFPDRTCCPKDIGEKKKKDFFPFLIGWHRTSLHEKGWSRLFPSVSTLLQWMGQSSFTASEYFH